MRLLRVRPTTSDLYNSLILNITSRANEIFLDGLLNDNNPNVFAKIGDSITYSIQYSLRPIGNGLTIWGSFSELNNIANYFMSGVNSFNREPYSAFPGWTSNSLVTNSPDGDCPSITPIECEYQDIKPSIGLLMIGTNDARTGVSVSTYNTNLRQAISDLIDEGVLPVLYTMPHTEGYDINPYNDRVILAASDYRIPLIDYYTLMERLPNRGLHTDGLHPSRPSDDNTADFRLSRLIYGYNARNLITLFALNRIFYEVMLPNL
jgi:hypothetical protein